MVKYQINNTALPDIWCIIIIKQMIIHIMEKNMFPCVVEF